MFFRAKNLLPVAENISLCGKPQHSNLCESEKAILVSSGVEMTGPVLLYPRLYLSTTRTYICVDSKRTLRDNSCVMYRKEGTFRFGTVHKLLQCSGGTFALVRTLIPLAQICTDDTTYAKIDDHLKMCTQT